MKFHRLDYLVDHSERFQSLSSTNPGIIEPCNVLMKNFGKMTPSRMSTGIHENVKKLSRASDSEQRRGRVLHGGVVSASVVSTKNAWKMMGSSL